MSEKGLVIGRKASFCNLYQLHLPICPWQVNTQIGPLRGASNFLGIMFNKIPFDAQVDTRFYIKVLENCPFGN